MELFIPPHADPETSLCSVRRFSLLDAMVLIGATAVGLAPGSSRLVAASLPLGSGGPEESTRMDRQCVLRVERRDRALGARRRDVDDCRPGPSASPSTRSAGAVAPATGDGGLRRRVLWTGLRVLPGDFRETKRLWSRPSPGPWVRSAVDGRVRPGGLGLLDSNPGVSGSIGLDRPLGVAHWALLGRLGVPHYASVAHIDACYDLGARWMAVVAVLALVLGAMVGIWRRARWFERLAESHAQDAFTYADAAWGCLRFHLNRDGDGYPAAGASPIDTGNCTTTMGGWRRSTQWPRPSLAPREPDPPEPKCVPLGGSGDP